MLKKATHCTQQYRKYASQIHAQIKLSQPLFIRLIQAVVNVVEAAIFACTEKAAEKLAKSSRDSRGSDETVNYRVFFVQKINKCKA